MQACEKCWRDYAEIIHTNLGVYKYCGLHAKILKDRLDEIEEEYY